MIKIYPIRMELAEPDSIYNTVKLTALPPAEISKNQIESVTKDMYSVDIGGEIELKDFYAVKMNSGDVFYVENNPLDN